MDMTPEELKEIVRSAVKEALEKQVLACACGLQPEAQRELAHFLAVVRHLGGPYTMTME